VHDLITVNGAFESPAPEAWLVFDEDSTDAGVRVPFTDDITWDDAVRTADEAGFDDLLKVALTRLSEHRPYEGWSFPMWLRAILDGLERFPGKGWPLIREGLTSAVMMERRFGINGMWTFGGTP
jgi:hypothetical protein